MFHFGGAALALSLVTGFMSTAMAAEHPLNRNVQGRIEVGFGNFDAEFPVPAYLESSVDDVADQFTIHSLSYANGGGDVAFTASGTTTARTRPDDFPGSEVVTTMQYTMNWNRVEWSTMPVYVDLPPADLTFTSGDTWRATPSAAEQIGLITLRFLGEITAVADGETVTGPFEATLQLRPAQLAPFYFGVGANYPETLQMGTYTNEFSTGQVSLPVTIGGVTYHIDRTFRGGFRQVPEPATASLALLAGATFLTIAGARRRRHG
jgi:hypothetical protein